MGAQGVPTPTGFDGYMGCAPFLPADPLILSRSSNPCPSRCPKEKAPKRLLLPLCGDQAAILPRTTSSSRRVAGVSVKVQTSAPRVPELVTIPSVFSAVIVEDFWVEAVFAETV